MQKSARCSGLWRFKYFSACTFLIRNNAFLHSSMLSTEKTQLQPSCNQSTREQELSIGSIEENYQHTEQLRQRNCWKLWQLRGLSVDEISCTLHMRRDTIINTILSFERKRENVDWHRLCNLVMLTTSTVQAILVARSKAKREISSSCGAPLFSASDIKNFCPQNVTYSHIYLVHMMLGRKLTLSEILNLASFTDLDFKGTYQAEATDSDFQWTCQAESTANARVINTAFPEYNGNMKYDSREESVDFVRPTARNNKVFESACVAVNKEYADAFLNMSLAANGRWLASKVCQEEKDTAAFRNMAYDSAGGKNLGFHHQVTSWPSASKDESLPCLRTGTDSGSVTDVAEQKLVTRFDILQWLQNNDMATVSDIVNAFGFCKAKHLLFLLLEMLESSIVVEQEGMLRITSEQSSSRLEPTKSSQGSFSLLINKRMHRALCLKAVILNVVIHEPKKHVEFVIRHVKADDKSNVYHVQICKYPSCTCPDFVMGVRAGLDYMPCKHLLYVYLVQLHLEKNHDHIMLQRTLKEEDLERILEGHY